MNATGKKNTFDCAPDGSTTPAPERCDAQCPHWTVCMAERDKARKHYTNEGIENTIHAITRRAMTDYIRTKSNEQRAVVQKQITSAHFEALTGLKGKTILSAIKRAERS